MAQPFRPVSALRQPVDDALLLQHRFARHRDNGLASQQGCRDADAGDAPDLGSSVVDAIDDRRLHEALVASLAELDEHVRTAVLLRYQQGFTFEEMAEVCGEKAGTLHARVTRAIQLLRAGIEAHLEGSPSDRVRRRRHRRSR